jgi:hypothetical protein
MGPATAAAAATPAAAAPGPCGTATATPTYRHVIWIWMENHSYTDIIGNQSQAPYLNTLAAECGVAANYHNVSHPSLPNYLGATAGLTGTQLPLLSYTDCDVSLICDTSAQSISFFNHYSLLGTTEQLLGLPRLDQAASNATMTASFKL